MSVLDYSFSNTATAPQNSGNYVPDMSCSFTLTGAEDVLVQFSLLALRNGGEARLILYVDGSPYQPGGAADNYYTLYQGESNIHQGNGSWIISLGAGAHTIEMYWTDALAVAATTFYNRYLLAEKMVVAS